MSAGVLLRSVLNLASNWPLGLGARINWMVMLGWSFSKAWTCCFSQGFSLLSMRMNQMSFTWACGRVASRLDAYAPCPISGTNMARAATTKDKRFIAPESFLFADSHILSRLSLPLGAFQA